MGEYVYKKDGIDIIDKLAPKSPAEKKFVLESMHLSKFNDRYSDGTHILGPLLQEMSVDTVVMTGGWTEDCILGTIADAVDAWGLDAIAVKDGVGTATTEHRKAESIYKTSYAAMYTADELTKFMASKDGPKYFLKPMVEPEDTKIQWTTEPAWQKYYHSAAKALNKTALVKGIKGPITLAPGVGGPINKPDASQQQLAAENLRLKLQLADLKEELARHKAANAPTPEPKLVQMGEQEEDLEELPEDEVVPEELE